MNADEILRQMNIKELNNMKDEAWEAFKYVTDDYSPREKMMGLDKKLTELALRKDFEEYWIERLKKLIY